MTDFIIHLNIGLGCFKLMSHPIQVEDVKRRKPLAYPIRVEWTIVITVYEVTFRIISLSYRYDIAFQLHSPGRNFPLNSSSSCFIENVDLSHAD